LKSARAQIGLSAPLQAGVSLLIKCSDNSTDGRASVRQLSFDLCGMKVDLSATPVRWQRLEGVPAKQCRRGLVSAWSVRVDGRYVVLIAR